MKVCPAWRQYGFFLGALLSVTQPAFAQQNPTSEPVEWRTLTIGAGGQLTGIDIAPDGTKVVKADTFGAYIWDPISNQWGQLVTASSEILKLAGAHGVWEIAIAPSRSTRLFMIYNNEVYRTDDRGRRWLKTSLRGISGADANGPGKFANQKMAIDPANADVVYVGTPTNGVWRTFDGGASWQRISQIPAAMFPGNAGIAFDNNSGKAVQRTKTIYVPSYGQGVWRSQDAGASWTQISGRDLGGPIEVWTAQMGADGIYWCSDHKDVWKFSDNAWTRVLNYPASAVVTDPKLPGRTIVTGPSGGKSGKETLDNGKSWIANDTWYPKYPPPGVSQIAEDIPWLAHADTVYMTIGDMKIDPTDGLVYFAEGIGVWKADWPKTFRSFAWVSQSKGIEELVANNIIAPPNGTPIVASWDRPFFRSVNPDKPPSEYGPVNGGFAGGWDIDYASSDSSFVVGLANWGDKDVSGYSTDSGKTWHEFAAKPAWKLGGSIAAATPQNIVWVSGNNGIPFYTKDGGAIWKAAPGLPPDGWIFAYYLKRRIITADRVKIGTFYLYNYKYGLFATSDGGDTWSLVFRGEIAPLSGVNAVLKAVPGHAGHLWFTSGGITGTHPVTNAYFRRSTDGGKTWQTVPHVLEVSSFGFGKARHPNAYPAIYIVGWVNSTYGIWRSDDAGTSWTNIGNYPTNSIDGIGVVNGDMNTYGTVYVGFAGSGYAYGILRNNEQQ